MLDFEKYFPFAEINHSELRIVEIHKKPNLKLKVVYPGYDRLRRKTISYRIQSTSMDFCKIAMTKFREGARQDYDAGNLKSLPKMVNCVHDEIAVECDKQDIKRVQGILEDAMTDNAHFQDIIDKIWAGHEDAGQYKLNVDIEVESQDGYCYAAAK